ncbi:hypothetical protein YC2023_076737 [Brassica napus]
MQEMIQLNYIAKVFLYPREENNVTLHSLDLISSPPPPPPKPHLTKSLCIIGVHKCVLKEKCKFPNQCVGWHVKKLTFVCCDESHHNISIGLDSSKASCSSRASLYCRGLTEEPDLIIITQKPKAPKE